MTQPVAKRKSGRVAIKERDGYCLSCGKMGPMKLVTGPSGQRRWRCILCLNKQHKFGG